MSPQFESQPPGVSEEFQILQLQNNLNTPEFFEACPITQTNTLEHSVNINPPSEAQLYPTFESPLELWDFSETIQHNYRHATQTTIPMPTGLFWAGSGTSMIQGCEPQLRAFANKESAHSQKRDISMRRHTCNSCGANFSTPTNLNRHKLSWKCGRASQIHRCDWCKRAYNRKDNLDKHWREKHEATLSDYIAGGGKEVETRTNNVEVY